MGPGQNVPPGQCSLSPQSPVAIPATSAISMPRCCPLPQGGSPLVTLWEVDNPLTSLSLLSEPCLPSHLSVQKGLWVTSSATVSTPSCQEAPQPDPASSKASPLPLNPHFTRDHCSHMSSHRLSSDSMCVPCYCPLLASASTSVLSFSFTLPTAFSPPCRESTGTSSVCRLSFHN